MFFALCRQGAGVYFYKTGDKYQGEWNSDVRMGRGRMEYANGDVYDGEWLDDKRHGMGILVLGAEAAPCACSHACAQSPHTFPEVATAPQVLGGSQCSARIRGERGRQTQIPRLLTC